VFEKADVPIEIALVTIVMDKSSFALTISEEVSPFENTFGKTVIKSTPTISITSVTAA